MVLLIQYKTVRLYTPLEHKNFSLAAGADDTGLFMENSLRREMRQTRIHLPELTSVCPE